MKIEQAFKKVMEMVGERISVKDSLKIIGYTKRDFYTGINKSQRRQLTYQRALATPLFPERFFRGMTAEDLHTL